MRVDYIVKNRSLVMIPITHTLFYITYAYERIISGAMVERGKDLGGGKMLPFRAMVARYGNTRSCQSVRTPSELLRRKIIVFASLTSNTFLCVMCLLICFTNLIVLTQFFFNAEAQRVSSAIIKLPCNFSNWTDCFIFQNFCLKNGTF